MMFCGVINPQSGPINAEHNAQQPKNQLAAKGVQPLAERFSVSHLPNLSAGDYPEKEWLASSTTAVIHPT